jgi:hypothetical protein
MARGRDEDIPALSSYIESRAEVANAVSEPNTITEKPEVEPTSTRFYAPGWRYFSVHYLKRLKTLQTAVGRIHIQDPDASGVSGGNSYVGVWPATPPITDAAWVKGGTEKAVRRVRVLAGIASTATSASAPPQRIH